MLKTRLQSNGNDSMWNWAIENGYFDKIYSRGVNVSILYLGSADYSLIPINEKGGYDPACDSILYSINGQFREWVKNGMRGTIKGVRWTVNRTPYNKTRWNIGCCLDRLAIELIMGELVDYNGNPIPWTPIKEKV